jgi:hypothetical protein
LNSLKKPIYDRFAAFANLSFSARKSWPFSGNSGCCSSKANRYNVLLTFAASSAGAAYRGISTGRHPPDFEALKGTPMEKWLCWVAMGTAGGLLILFILDLVMQFPFRGLNTVVNILGILACALVGYLGWDAYKDLR